MIFRDPGVGFENWGMDSDAPDGLFDEALVQRVPPVTDDGVVEAGAGVSRWFKPFDPEL